MPFPADIPLKLHDLGCPYCCPILRRVEKGIAIHGGRLVRMGRQHPLRRGLPFWERSGTFDLWTPGIVNRIYYPGDHEVCTYDNHFRLQTSETMGGYRQSGQLDGNGIRARLKNGPTDDSFEMRWGEFYGPDGFLDEWHPGSFVVDPDADANIFPKHPDWCEEWLCEYRFKTSRATRIIPDPGSSPESVCLDFADDRGRDDHWWHPDKKFILWKFRSPQHWEPIRPFLPARVFTIKILGRFKTGVVSLHTRPVGPLEDAFSFWSPRPWRLQPRVQMSWKWPPQHMDFLSCLMCLKHWATEREIKTWKRKYWQHSKEKWCNLTDEQRRELPAGRNRRKTWKANWCTDRKMRDLTARLELENYGWEQHDQDGSRPNTTRYNVARMATAVNARLHPAFLAESHAKGVARKPTYIDDDGNVKREFWPGEINSRLTPLRIGPREHKSPVRNGPRKGPSAISLDLPIPYACSPWPASTRC